MKEELTTDHDIIDQVFEWCYYCNEITGHKYYTNEEVCTKCEHFEEYEHTNYQER